MNFEKEDLGTLDPAELQKVKAMWEWFHKAAKDEELVATMIVAQLTEASLMKRGKRKAIVAGSEKITSVLSEKRLFKPTSEFSKNAEIKSFAQYRRLYQQSVRSS